MFVRADLVRFDLVLPNDEVHVWYADLETAQHRISLLHQLLNKEEHTRASRFKVAAACDQFVISRAFLRLALGGYLQIGPHEVRFQTTVYGKPELADGGSIQFNLSHTHGAAALVVTRKSRGGS